MKRGITLLALAGISLIIEAAPAAEPLGRFFFTPAQRAQLDGARAQKSRAALSSEKSDENAMPGILTYSGAVRRSDGKSTVWINNQAINDRKAAGGVVIDRLRPNGALTLQVPQTDRGVELKVGQSVDIVSGTIEEPYARHPAAPKAAARPAPAMSASGSIAPAPAGAAPPVTGTGTATLKPETGSTLERLRSRRREQSDNDQDRR